MSRTDVFHDRKCVHVKLDKDVHAALRARLFQHNVSMQEVFDEFARQFVSGDAGANRIVERYVMRKVQALIAGEKKPRRSAMQINELDHDAIYNLIDEEGIDPDEAARETG